MLPVTLLYYYDVYSQKARVEGEFCIYRKNFLNFLFTQVIGKNYSTTGTS